MSDEDLRELDLSAWEVPAPRVDLADRVIARMREPAGAVAVEPVVRATRRWWLGGAVAAVAVAAAIALVIARGDTGGAPGYGAVIADRARELSIGDTRGELDRGALVVWRREGDVLVVAQAGGAATWRTGDGHRLRIEAAGASIESDATGASLRVEVNMNLADARLIGASALTAAAVAFATVIVYEGHIKVSRDGWHTTVEPGTTIELRRGEPPGPPPVVGADDDRIRKLEDEVQRLREQQQPAPAGPVARGPDSAADQAELHRLEPGLVECATKLGFTRMAMTFAVHHDTTDLEVRESGGGNDEAALLGCLKDIVQGGHFTGAQLKFSWAAPATTPDALGRAQISEAMQRAKAELGKCKVKTGGVVKVRVEVGGDGRVTAATVVSAKDASLGGCVVAAIKATSFARTNKGGSFSYPFVFSVVPQACDADELKQAGLDHEAQGLHAAALGAFEQALKCKDDAGVVLYAFMAACNAGSVTKAREFWRKLSADDARRFAQLCIRRGITKAQLDGS
ncbi:MAG TPA: hypothetical protein VGF94_18215 [Kofleriaceae bacterium]|jgi:hypothetical protein